MGVFSSSGLIAFTFILLLQRQIMMETVASQPQFTAPDSSLLYLTDQADSHFHNTSNNGNRMDQRLKRNKFLIRKCCGRGQIYNFNMEEVVADRKDQCVKYSITESSSQTKNKNQIFIGHKQHLPSGYALENFEVDTGFPRNCVPDMLLEPDRMKEADLFYPLPSGQLIVPHRFWLLQFDVHCIEDYFVNGNFTKPRRVAFICSSNATPFPTTAIDNVGKLQLDFIGPVIPAELSPIAGRTVIRKCCDQNEVYSSLGQCTKNQEFATDYFDDLQSTRRDIFFRIGFPLCYQNLQYTNNFNLTSNGSLAIGMSNSISDLSDQLLPVEHYCIEDVVSYDATGLPLTLIGAFFCLDQDNRDQHLSEFNTPDYPDYFSTAYETNYNNSVTPGQHISEFNTPEYPDYSDPTYEIDYNNSVNPGQNVSELSTPQYSGDFNTLYETDYNDSGKIKTPKCCPLGYVMDESDTCQLLKLGEGSSGEERIISQALNNYFLSEHKIVSNLIPNNSSGSCELIRLIPFVSYDASTEMKFEVDPKNELSLLIHLQTKNYWNFKLKPQLFCADFVRFRSEKEVSYQPQIFYCAKQEHHVSVHYPVLLCISAAGLIVTLIIYFFVPAKGSAKLVTTGFGAGSRGTRTPTMATMLTGRILLCHVFTLSLTFICLAMVQREYFPPIQTSCVAIGYFIYGASIASFAWLTVYCFDYYRIFTGAFKVSNDMLFIPYSIFGWGVPIIALIAMAITQFQSTELGVSDNVNPNIGLLNCWFPHDGISALVFFYGPVGTLLVLDMICFLSLIFNPNLMHCWRRKQSIRSNKKVSKEQEDFKMALKLFFITGIPWVFELAAWLPVYLSESQSIFQSNSVGRYFFEIGNLLNALRGIVIFIIFIVLQRDVRHYLMLRLKRIFKKDCPTNVALQHSRGNTDGDPSVSTEQLTNRRISAMTSQTLIASASSEEQSTNEPVEQAEFYEISIL